MFFSPIESLMFNLVPMIIFIGFIFIFGMIIVRTIQGISQWNKNNNSPVLTVSAVVVSKRMEVRHHNHHTNDSIHHGSSTTYYVTFQVESGDRIELKLSGTEYGMLVEKDQGNLTFQGTRYLGFNRNKIG